MFRHPQRIGRYQIVECVGRGGMGVLYRAHDAMLERDVAIKLMLVDFSGDNTARERFHREAKAIARLQHRNVVTIHELGEEDNTPFIVMEFLGGRDLEHIMREAEALPLDDKLDIVIQLCAGLAFAHEHGIVHRDIKPGNVRVLDDGTVKILDFGIAKLAIGGTTQVGMVMGSANYMAPEQAADEPVDGRADLFSTGVLLYELLSGRKPFMGESPTATLYQIVHNDPPPLSSLVPELPPQLEEIVARALRKNPEDRYSRASEMAADLQIVRAVVQSSTLSGMTLGGDNPAGTTLAGVDLDRGLASGTVAKLASAALRPVAGAPPLDVPIEKTPAPSTHTTVSADRRTTMILAGVAGLVAVIIIAVLVVRTGADRPAAPAPTPAPSPPVNAAPPPVASAPASLSIDSVPPGARILLDDVDTGKTTPAAVPIRGAAPKRLQLQLKGYLPLVAPLSQKDFGAGDTQVFTLTKEASPVRVTVAGAYPFQIVQGSRVVSPSSDTHAITVAPGQKGFRAVSPDVFLNESLDDAVRRGRPVRVPDLGTVLVFSTVERGCTIAIDGRTVGDPPIQNQSIAAGVHSFSARCEDGRTATDRATIVGGEQRRVSLDPRNE